MADDDSSAPPTADNQSTPGQLFIHITRYVSINGEKHVENFHTESKGNVNIYLTLTREWIAKENNALVGRVPLQFLKVSGSEIKFHVLVNDESLHCLRPNSGDPDDVKKFIKGLDLREVTFLGDQVYKSVREACMKIEKEKPEKFMIKMFVDMKKAEIWDEEKFNDKSGEIMGSIAEDVCPICQDGLLEKQCLKGSSRKQYILKKTLCKHLFHKYCLKPWSDENGTCPMCRESLDATPARRRQNID